MLLTFNVATFKRPGYVRSRVVRKHPNYLGHWFSPDIAPGFFMGIGRPNFLLQPVGHPMAVLALLNASDKNGFS